MILSDSFFYIESTIFSREKQKQYVAEWALDA